MTSPRNLVLLLSSGHTVRIALRDDDLTASLDSSPDIGVPELRQFLEMPAIVCTPSIRDGQVVFAYIEQEMSADFNRIVVTDGRGAPRG